MDGITLSDTEVDITPVDSDVSVGKLLGVKRKRGRPRKHIKHTDTETLSKFFQTTETELPSDSVNTDPLTENISVCSPQNKINKSNAELYNSQDTFSLMSNIRPPIGSSIEWKLDGGDYAYLEKVFGYVKVSTKQDGLVFIEDIGSNTRNSYPFMTVKWKNYNNVKINKYKLK